MRGPEAVSRLGDMRSVFMKMTGEEGERVRESQQVGEVGLGQGVDVVREECGLW